jgi:hypothetical protein
VKQTVLEEKHSNQRLAMTDVKFPAVTGVLIKRIIVPCAHKTAHCPSLARGSEKSSVGSQRWGCTGWPVRCGIQDGRDEKYSK